MGRAQRGTFTEATWAGRGFTKTRRGSKATYKPFVPDPIGDFAPQLRSETSALAEQAGAEVRALNAQSEGLVSLEGLARQLLRSEALASSRIEGLAVSHRKLAQAAIDQQGSHRAKEVLGNIQAMEAAISIGADADALTIQSITKIHEALALVPPLDKIAGQLREEQGWIGGATPLDADYVGPPAAEVKRLTRDLCEFMNRDDLSPVVQAAVGHAQFELIHPFGDGNGRVGRALIHSLFRRRGLAPQYVPPVSLVLGANKDAYIAGIQAFRRCRVDDWVSQFARAVELSAQHAEHFSSDVIALQKQWRERAQSHARQGDRQRALRRDAAVYSIIGVLPAAPIITSSTAAELVRRSDVAVLSALKNLESAGILTRHDNRKKGTTWEAGELFERLDRFEADVKVW